MPASITQGGATQSWLYDPEHSRYKLTTSGRTTWYVNPSVHQGGHYERTQYTSGTVEHRVTLYGGGRPIGEVLTFDSQNTPSQTRYFHSDAQGSITAVTDQNGTVITRYRYDPWGKQTLVTGSNTGIDATRQGHTGHEMLDNGLTHMNGRLYDPVLARFVSADPYVDTPFDLQSLNRYSYVNNNPLGYTDPSGYLKIFGKKWSWWRDKVVKPVVAAWLAPYAFNIGFWGVGSALGGGIAGGIGGTLAGAALAGMSTSLITTSSLDGWQYNAISVGLFFGAGQLGNELMLANNSFERALLHAGAGCISASAGGGNCGTGALTAGFTKYAGSNIPNLGYVGNFVKYAVIGGTAAQIGGGKFSNGAMTGAFQYLFNEATEWNKPKVGDFVRIKINGEYQWVAREYAEQIIVAQDAGVNLSDKTEFLRWRAEPQCVNSCVARDILFGTAQDMGISVYGEEMKKMNGPSSRMLIDQTLNVYRAGSILYDLGNFPYLVRDCQQLCVDAGRIK